MKIKPRKTIQYKEFPKSKLKRKAWAIAVKRNNWEPNDSSVICSEHFKEEDLDKTSECCVRVRENAVPSVFPTSQKHLRKRVKVPMMSNMKDERDDSENEEMEHDSGDSDKSSSTSDSSDASDSDDSSEMDGEECERRRNECIDNLADLEHQFVTLREQLYRERITQVKTKLEEVHAGIAKEYRQPLEELQDNMSIRIEVAGILRKLRLDNINNNFEAEEQAAKQNYENEKMLLWDSMKEELEEKIRRLEEDRNSQDFHTDWLSERGLNRGKGSRNAWKRGGKNYESSRRKPVTVSGPYIVYMLSEADIHEDWTIIKKALSVSKRNSECLYHFDIGDKF